MSGKGLLVSSGSAWPNSENGLSGTSFDMSGVSLLPLLLVLVSLKDPIFSGVTASGNDSMAFGEVSKVTGNGVVGDNPLSPVAVRGTGRNACGALLNVPGRSETTAVAGACIAVSAIPDSVILLSRERVGKDDDRLMVVVMWARFGSFGRPWISGSPIPLSSSGS